MYSEIPIHYAWKPRGCKPAAVALDSDDGEDEESVSDDNALSDSDPGSPGNLSFDNDEISDSPLFQNSLPDDDVVLESDDSLSDDEHLPSSAPSVPLSPLICFDDQDGAGPSGWIPPLRPVCSTSTDSDLDDTPPVPGPMQWYRDRFQN